MVALGMETGLGLPERRDGSGRHRPVDARLVVPATAAWAGAAGAGTWPPPAAVLVAACGVLAAAPVFVLTRLRRPRPPAGPGRPGVGVVAATAAVFLAAGVLAAGLPARHRATGPFAELVRQGATVTARIALTDDPRIAAASTGPAGGGQRSGPPGRADAAMFVVPARLERVTAAGSTLRLRARVVVLARGAGWHGLLPSQRVAVTARLAASRPGDTVAAVLFVDASPRLRGRPDAVQRIAGHLRDGLREAAAGLPEPRRGLLPALVVGDVSGLGTQVRADFRTAGMAHLTAVSGSNVAIVTASVLYVMRWTRRGLRSRAGVGALALVGFVVLARPSASVLRAGVMGLVGLLALALGRPRAVLPALAATVTVLVLADPALALSVGFALSALATASMIVLAPGWGDALGRRLPGRFAEVLAVAVAAQIACAPVLAWTGGGLSLVAIPANVLAVVAVAPATVLGVLTLVVAVVSAPAARLLAHLADLPCWWLVTVADRCAELPAATLAWPNGVGGAAAAAVLAGALVAAVRRRAGRRILAAALVGLLAVRFLVVPRWVPWPPVGWRVVACDVGQGDALVLSAGPGSAVLVDVGGDPDLVARCLDDLDVRQVPVIILSHFHADHVDGLPAVLGRLPVGEILVSPLREPVFQWHQVREAARRARVPLRTPGVGSGARVGAVSWTVLAPAAVPRGTDSDPNNASLVLLARVGEVSILLTGDIEPPAQRALVAPSGGRAAEHPADRSAPRPEPRPAGREGLRADVLKVPHHGAADLDPALLAATGARFALISVGAGNTYGHPAEPTLRALRTAGMAVARTDRNGAVAVVVDRPARRTPIGPGPTDPSRAAADDWTRTAGAALAAAAAVDVSVVLRRSGDGS